MIDVGRLIEDSLDIFRKVKNSGAITKNQVAKLSLWNDLYDQMDEANVKAVELIIKQGWG